MKREEIEKQLKELGAGMTREEFEQVMQALNESRDGAYRQTIRERGDRSDLFIRTERIESELVYVHKGKTGTLRVWGADLLTPDDYEKYRKDLPDFWQSNALWLRPGQLFKGGERMWRAVDSRAKICPALILKEPPGDLRPGSRLQICGEDFILLDGTRCIRRSPLGAYTGDTVTNGGGWYEDSILQFVTEGWYRSLIRRNEAARSAAQQPAEDQN